MIAISRVLRHTNLQNTSTFPASRAGCWRELPSYHSAEDTGHTYVQSAMRINALNTGTEGSHREHQAACCAPRRSGRGLAAFRAS